MPPPTARQLIEMAGARLLSAWAPGLNPNVTKVREGNAATSATCITQRHCSVLEHCTVTYGLRGRLARVHPRAGAPPPPHVSARNRSGSSASTTGRLPSQAFAWNDRAVEIMEAVFGHADRPSATSPSCSTSRRADFGRKKEITSAMRRCAPMGLTTSIIATGNLRAWREVIEKGCTTRRGRDRGVRRRSWSTFASSTRSDRGS